MRILTRYILREVLSHAALGLALFTFVIFMRDAGHVLELVVRNSSSFGGVVKIFLLTLPTAFTITIPMAVLLGILIGLSRLASDSEITAMRASGIGVRTFVRIILMFAVAALALSVFNNLYIAPRAAQAIDRLEDQLKASQASFEVQPQVFYEDFKNYVLYVQDASVEGGHAVWKNVWLADITQPQAPKLILAKDAVVLNEGENEIRLHLIHGEEHETQPRQPEQYQISTFSETDLPIALPSQEPKIPRELLPSAELGSRELWTLSHNPQPYKARWYAIEWHRRLATSCACLVFALVGIPLGMASKRGGKSSGFVVTIVLVFLYYVLYLIGVALARQGKLSPMMGVWAANLLFFLFGLWLLYRANWSSLEVMSIASVRTRVKQWWKKQHEAPRLLERRRGVRRRFISRFPQIIDDYILRTFVGNLLLVISSFLILMLVFTFFELLGDIIRNRVPVVTVAGYLLNVIPYLLYQLTPLSVLLAVLVTFTLMQRANEITAMKATGISIYRAIIPVVAIAAVISVLLFAFDQSYLPVANRRQEMLRNTIKGKPAQTVLRADHRWIFGQENGSNQYNIYYYDFFDPDRNAFANLNVFEVDAKTFQITKRIFAEQAHFEPELRQPIWVLENGWTRSFADVDGRASAIENFHTFDVASFPELSEAPSYFKKEVKQSSEMSFAELRRYIADLQQSGFEVVRLRVQLYRKLAYPLITLVMAVLAVPFALRAGRKAALTGIVTAIAIAVIYTMVSGLFEAMGNVNYLPPVLAAWIPDLLFGIVGGYLILRVPS